VGTQKNDRLTCKNDRLAFAYKGSYGHARQQLERGFGWNVVSAGTWFRLERGFGPSGPRQIAVVLLIANASQQQQVAKTIMRTIIKT